jgi:hypothetical protein
MDFPLERILNGEFLFFPSSLFGLDWKYILSWFFTLCISFLMNTPFEGMYGQSFDYHWFCWLNIHHKRWYSGNWVCLSWSISWIATIQGFDEYSSLMDGLVLVGLWFSDVPRWHSWFGIGNSEPDFRIFSKSELGIDNLELLRFGIADRECSIIFHQLVMIID